MDLRLGPAPRAHIVPHPEEGFRAVIGRAVGHARDQAVSELKNQAKDQAPKAEAVAARWVERTRPAWSWLAVEWRRLGTLAAVILIVGLLLHAMFGANGMVVYHQKRSEMQSLQSEVQRLQKENDLYVGQIKSLKSDPAAIEKEAREQLHYTRPGEVVYVAPDLPQKPPTGQAKINK
jgi:cell division protein FtsB